jgi:HAMP domain-containing protein
METANVDEQKMKAMKTFTAFVLSTVLFASFAVAGPTEADQRWLNAVEQKVNAGDTSVATPSQARVDLLKSWAEKNRYSVTVTKTETGFNLSLSKNIAQK